MRPSFLGNFFVSLTIRAWIHRNTLHHTAAHRSTPQHTTTHHNTPQHTASLCSICLMLLRLPLPRPPHFQSWWPGGLNSKPTIKEKGVGGSILHSWVISHISRESGRRARAFSRLQSQERERKSRVSHDKLDLYTWIMPQHHQRGPLCLLITTPVHPCLFVYLWIDFLTETTSTLTT